MRQKTVLAAANRALFEARALGRERMICVFVTEAIPDRREAVRAFAVAQTPALKIKRGLNPETLCCLVPLVNAPRLLPALFAAAQLPSTTSCVGEPLYIMYPDVLAEARASLPGVSIAGRESLYEW